MLWRCDIRHTTSMADAPCDRTEEDQQMWPQETWRGGEGLEGARIALFVPGSGCAAADMRRGPLTWWAGLFRLRVVAAPVQSRTSGNPLRQADLAYPLPTEAIGAGTVRL